MPWHQYQGSDEEQHHQEYDQDRLQQPKENKNLEDLLDNLKNDIVKSVSTQILSIKNQVLENTSKINYISGQIGSQCP